jgi:hypothetical protein
VAGGLFQTLGAFAALPFCVKDNPCLYWSSNPEEYIAEDFPEKRRFAFMAIHIFPDQFPISNFVFPETDENVIRSEQF